jgi:hypothetical protein
MLAVAMSPYSSQTTASKSESGAPCPKVAKQRQVSALGCRSKNFGVVLWINLLQLGKELGTAMREVANDPVESGEESFKACRISCLVRLS